MREGIAWLLAAPALWFAAARIAPPTTTLPELGQAFARPFALPWLWSSLAQAERSGSPGEMFAKGRVLLELLPRWTDGHVHFAALLALDASLAARSPEAALEPLLGSLAFLEDSLAHNPRDAADLLGTMALFLQIRCPPGSPLADAFRSRCGRDAAEAGDELLERALAALPVGSVDAPYLRDRRAWLATRLIAGALRVGDRARARRYVELALARLAAAQDQEHARTVALALARLAAWLDGDPAVDLQQLRAEPALAEVVAALPER